MYALHLALGTARRESALFPKVSTKNLCKGVEVRESLLVCCLDIIGDLFARSNRIIETRSFECDDAVEPGWELEPVLSRVTSTSEGRVRCCLSQSWEVLKLKALPFHQPWERHQRSIRL